MQSRIARDKPIYMNILKNPNWRAKNLNINFVDVIQVTISTAYRK